MNFLLASTLVLLSVGSMHCYSIIRMPLVQSYSQMSGHDGSVNPCGPLMCMNGGQCQMNPYDNGVSCVCHQPYFGNQCQFYQPQQPGVSRVPKSNMPNNLCRVFNDRNMNICQNGGQCVFVADGKVACICPSTFKGLFCELPVYLPCNGNPSLTCHRDYGICAVNGSCICIDGYTGPRCDKLEACKTDYCLNGANCSESDVDPYRKCDCQPNYFGRRCEIFGIQLANGTIIKYNRSCNLTISVFNQGGYIARFIVDYQDYLGKPFTLKSGDFASGQTRHVQVPFYGQNVAVKIYTIHGELIKNDTSLVKDLPCKKCNKIWGPVGNAQWDYIRC